MSLTIIAWVEIEDLDWPDPAFRKFALFDLAIVIVFLIEFLVRLRRADNKWRFLLHNWYELPGFVPLYADSFSWLRATKILRVVRVVRLLRVVSALQRLKRSFSFVNTILRRSHLGATFVIACLVMLLSASAFWIAERGSNKAMDSYDDALWWAISTTTTVGYGDISPQTGPGRMVAAVLMFLGIGLVGVVASSLSAAIVATNAQTSPQDVVAKLEELVKLKQAGELSAEEFVRAKTLLLGQSS